MFTFAQVGCESQRDIYERYVARGMTSASKNEPYASLILQCAEEACARPCQVEVSDVHMNYNHCCHKCSSLFSSCDIYVPNYLRLCQICNFHGYASRQVLYSYTNRHISEIDVVSQVGQTKRRSRQTRAYLGTTCLSMKRWVSII